MEARESGSLRIQPVKPAKPAKPTKVEIKPLLHNLHGAKFSCTFAVLVKKRPSTPDVTSEFNTADGSILRAGTFSDANPSFVGVNSEWKTINTVTDTISFDRAQSKMYEWLMQWPHLKNIWNLLHKSDQACLQKKLKGIK